ncbi:MAG: glycosyltransferase, partial [Roseofilum sp. SID2]
MKTLHFVLRLLLFGVWYRPNLVVTTHANFAIAAFLLKRLTGTPYWIIAHGIEVWNIDRPNL